MTIAHVNSTTLSTHDLYNQLATSVSTLMAPTPTGYGFANSSISTVTNAMTITLLEWQKLYYEANQIYNHITGTPIPDQGDLPYLGSNRLLQAKHVNLIIDAVNIANATPHVASPRQLTPLTIQDVSNPTWDSSIASVVNIPWADDASAQYFFNLGGKIQSTLHFDQVRPGIVEDKWIRLITKMQELMAGNPYDHSLYIQQTPITFTASFNDIIGDYITLTYTPVSAHEITVTVGFVVGTIGAGADSAFAKGIRIFHTCKTYCSVGSLPAPRPLNMTVTTGLHENGQAITPVIKTLQVDRTTINYNMHQYDESAKEVITLTNTGNTELHVAAVVFSKGSNNQGPIPNVYFGPGWVNTSTSTVVLTLLPQASTTLAVSYVSQYLGSFNNFIHLRSDCQNGNGIVAIKTKQIVRGPVFRAVLGIAPSIDSKNYHVIKNQAPY